jgi:hypothetical protein
MSVSSIVIKSNLPVYPKPIRLGIVGPRDFRDSKLVYDFIDFFRENYDVRYIVSGGMRKDLRGVDTIAELYSNIIEIPKIIYPPQTKKYGYPVCFFKRNEQIATTSDIIGAVWLGTGGTLDTMTRAHKKNKPVVTINLQREVAVWEPNILVESA